MTEEDDDFVAISALQHVVFCERQAALIHVERVWEENQLTMLGQVVHARADERGRDLRRGTRVERAVWLRCARLRIWGLADAIEWAHGSARPVETKRGAVTDRLADRVQVCAQALCIEEMLTVRVDVGVLFYAASHRRVEFPLDASLRSTTERACSRMHEIIAEGRLPAPEFGAKCRACSLQKLCQPLSLGGSRSAADYLAAMFDLR